MQDARAVSPSALKRARGQKGCSGVRQRAARCLRLPAREPAISKLFPFHHLRAGHVACERLRAARRARPAGKGGGRPRAARHHRAAGSSQNLWQGGKRGSVIPIGHKFVIPSSGRLPAVYPSAPTRKRSHQVARSGQKKRDAGRRRERRGARGHRTGIQFARTEPGVTREFMWGRGNGLPAADRCGREAFGCNARTAVLLFALA